MGLHAWDHFTWQAKIDRFTPAQMHTQMQRGFDKLTELLGEAPTCSAAAGWRCNEQALLMKERYGFTYNSDCRGHSVFIPSVAGAQLTVQIPVTLPTYDEIIGAHGVTEANYSNTILTLCKPNQLNVYTIHAEVEGISHLQKFEQMLVMARDYNIKFQPLGELIPQGGTGSLPVCQVLCQDLPGREGWLATQGNGNIQN